MEKRTAKYDSIIIGFGKGGKTLAADLAAKNEKVAIIERSDRMYGGTCINVGCIPTKSLVNSSHMAKIKDLGSFEEKAKFFKEAMAEKERVVTMLRAKNYEKLANHPNVTVFNGEGSFLCDHQIRVEYADGSEEILVGDKIFINTGSAAFVPNIEGLAGSKHTYTSEGLLELTELPRHLIILGGGYISLEFASYYMSFGSKVTLLQKGEEFIPKEDREIQAQVLKILEDKGMTLITQATPVLVADKGDGVEVTVDVASKKEKIEGDAFLVATGRRPNVKKLNLENADIELTDRGGVKVNERMQTSRSHIYAMGDVVGGLQFTYKSLDDYRIVKSALEGGDYVDAGRNLAYSVFMDPPLSRIGLTADEAEAKGYKNIVEVSLPAAAIPKAHVLRHPVGLLKAVINMDDKTVLGATLLCEESYEMINIVKTVMDNNLTYTVLRDQIFTHPTMSEALNDLFNV